MYASNAWMHACMNLIYVCTYIFVDALMYMKANIHTKFSHMNPHINTHNTHIYTYINLHPHPHTYSFPPVDPSELVKRLFDAL